MRDIKFRAFFDGKMYPVNNLDYIQDGSGIIAHIHVKGIDQEIPSGQFELMQYTGLTDRNGQEIYEGDIVRYRQHMFNTERTRIKEKEIRFDCGSFNVYETNAGQDEHVVIGNIFEGAEK
jgi:uncharacterized phage protein (TIGR01671 family)